MLGKMAKNRILENRFEEKMTQYLRELAEYSQPIRDMYFFNSEYENIPVDMSRDILLEKKYSPIKGLVHKFGNRVAVFLSYTCAANCRYCERQDRVGVGLDTEGRLKSTDIDVMLKYISSHTELNEVIFSGGDPLTNPLGLLYFCQQLERIEHIKIIRIHTRMPLQLPSKVDWELLQKIVQTKEVCYFSIHVNHSDELNEITIPILKRIRKMGYIMLSQSVFLKGINDSVDILKNLFTLLSENGIRPYYIYHCQTIPTTRRFVMSIADEVKIMTELRNVLSGIAYPDHVIDLQNAVGKIIIPSLHWGGNYANVTDYLGKKINLDNYDK
jgi:lysine 2,3-aminomutase